MNNPKYIVVHCSDVSYRQVFDQYNAINQYHKDQGFTYSSLKNFIGYHRLITGNTNYQCRTDYEEGCHTATVVDGLSMNVQSLGICVGFDGDIEYPTPKQYELLQQQIWNWMDRYNIPGERVLMHRHFNKNKTCPGSLIGDEWMRRLVIGEGVKPEPEQEKQQDIINAHDLSLMLQVIDLAKQAIALIRAKLNLLHNT